MDDPQIMPTVICITPVKDEAWILERFLSSASLWADHIIIADQGSSDSSVEIAKTFEKVKVVRNADDKYDEGRRQQILLHEARKIPGPRILFALDADEILSADWMTDPEWKSVFQAPPGTRILMKWANIAPDMRSAWIPPSDRLFGYIDDDAPHKGDVIHSPRLPSADSSRALVLNVVRVLHYQYTDWERMLAKQRWYQCWERIHYPEKRPIDLYRQYHHMEVIPPEQITPIRPSWFSGYVETGIDMTSVSPAGREMWEAKLVDLVKNHSAAAFRRLDIWDSPSLRGVATGELTRIEDPRSLMDKWVLNWLRRTQSRPAAFGVKTMQRLLRLWGW